MAKQTAECRKHNKFAMGQWLLLRRRELRYPQYLYLHLPMYQLPIYLGKVFAGTLWSRTAIFIHLELHAITHFHKLLLRVLLGWLACQPPSTTTATATMIAHPHGTLYSGL